MGSKKEELLKLACHALQKGGVSGFSFRDLAKEAGIKSSSVHYHFRNKNELYREIIIKFRESVAFQLMEIEKASSSLEELLMKAVAFFESTLDEDKFCVCGMLAAEVSHLDESVKSELQETFKELEIWFFESISSYNIEDDKARDITCMLIAAMEGSLLIDRLMRNRDHFNSLRSIIKLLV